MAVHFTTDQQNAIDTLDKSILVSAAAGSGKTAVLVERIIHIILEGKANVDEMLVVTFTNAAAAEMKLKLTKALTRRMKEDPSSARAMSVQLDRMYKAYISTFHSFALRLIREFFYKVDREPTFKICDEAQGALLQMEAMDELFEQCFEQDDYIEGGSFRDFLRHYSSDRSEDALIAEMIQTYGKLRSMPKYFEWADRKAEQLKYPASGDIRDSEVFKEIMVNVRTELEGALKSCEKLYDMLDESGLPKLAEKINREYESIEALIAEASHCEDVDGFCARVSGWKAETLRVTKDEKDDYEPIKDLCKEMHDEYKKNITEKIRDNYFNPDMETRFREMDASYAYTKYYLNLLREFEVRFDEKKSSSNLIDFGDIEHICVSILDDPTIAEIVRKRFNFVFIDEYQDTNQLQEYLISKISRPDNVFKVGDVKQSIYGFRQSDPTIFMDTREAYDQPDNTDATVIDLNRNFRSNGATINYINHVFEDIMPGYDDKAKLYHGLKTHEVYDLVPDIHVLLQQRSDATAEELAEAEDLEQTSKAESEATYIARLVKSIIGTEFHDGARDVVRKATPRDIVILMRGTRNSADAYYKAMLEQNIVAHVNDDSGYFDTVEIHVAMALLQTLDNGKLDVPLISVLRSEIFGFSTVELAEIRAAYKEDGGSGAYYKAFNAYIRHAEGELADKARAAAERIDGWRYLANKMPLDDYIWHVLTDSGYYLYAGAMYGGRQRQANLRVLAERARRYQENGVASLSGFLRYIDVLRSKDVKTGQASMVSEEDDVVRIMTMHKSKGLEFPFVIVAGMGNRLNYDTASKGFLFDSELGVGLSYVNREEKFFRTTLLQRLIVDKKRSEGYQEELRILYVAMTRAREKLILVGTVKNEKELEGMPKEGSFYQIIKENLHTSLNTFRITDAPQRRLTRKKNMLEEFLEVRGSLDQNRAAEYAEAAFEKLDYVYPEKEALETKAKYSVSEIRSRKEAAEAEAAEEQKRKIELADPEFQSVAAVTGADIGTAYHRIMQTVDFAKVVKFGVIDDVYLEETAQELVSKGAIDERIYPKLKMERLIAFFESEIGQRAVQAASAGTLRKEKAFTLQTEVDGQEVLVQGIIDCYFEENGELVLVDYKSNYVGRDVQPIVDMYREQLRLYRQALELGSGKTVRESYLYLLHTGTAVAVES